MENLELKLETAKIELASMIVGGAPTTAIRFKEDQIFNLEVAINTMDGCVGHM